jgi:hypothetical protein
MQTRMSMESSRPSRRRTPDSSLRPPRHPNVRLRRLDLHVLGPAARADVIEARDRVGPPPVKLRSRVLQQAVPALCSAARGHGVTSATAAGSCLFPASQASCGQAWRCRGSQCGHLWPRASMQHACAQTKLPRSSVAKSAR